MSKMPITHTIQECCEILDNLRVPINDEVRQTIKGNIPYYGANGVQGYINKFIFDEDLILMAEDGGNFEQYDSRPIAYKISGKSWVNNHAHILRAKNGFVQDYIFYSLVHKNILKYIKGGTRSKLNKSELEKIEIQFPEHETTQLKIAKILSTADTVIEKTQAAIDKYKAIKQGMLHDLFTRGIDTKTGKLRPKYEDAPELYKESKLGWIPKEWEVERFENITAEAILGVTVRGTSNNEANIPLLKMGNLIWGELILNHVEYVMHSAIETERYLLKYRDFLFNTRNTPELVGKTAIWREEFPITTFDNNLLRIRFKKEIASPYVCYFMSFGKGRNNIKSLVDGTTSVAAVYWKNLKEYKVPFPDRKEQEVIIRRLESIDNKIQTEQTYLHKLQQVKAGLMADLLSGKKEVTIDEEMAN